MSLLDMPKCQCLCKSELEHLSKECAALRAVCAKEIEALKARLERITENYADAQRHGYLGSNSPIYKERDALLQTLAKERDEFGKRETELKALVETVKHDLRITQEAHIEALGERDALKAEMKRLTMQIEVISNSDKAWEKDAALWRGIAESFIKEARLIKSYFEQDWPMVLHKSDVRPLMDALTLYDEAAGK